MTFTPNDDGKNAALSGGLTDAILFLALHSANPGSTGTNPTSAARLSVAWNAPSAGSSSMTAAKNFTGGASNGAAQFVGAWSAVTGGTFYGYWDITGDQTFNAAGEYTLDTLTLTAS